MIQTAEQVIEQIRALPISEQQRFYKLFEVLESELMETENQLEQEKPHPEVFTYSETK